MPRLTSEQRSETIGILRANMTVSQVANHFNVSRICIWELKTKFQTTGTVKDRPGVMPRPPRVLGGKG